MLTQSQCADALIMLTLRCAASMPSTRCQHVRRMQRKRLSVMRAETHSSSMLHLMLLLLRLVQLVVPLLRHNSKPFRTVKRTSNIHSTVSTKVLRAAAWAHPLVCLNQHLWMLLRQVSRPNPANARRCQRPQV